MNVLKHISCFNKSYCLIVTLILIILVISFSIEHIKEKIGVSKNGGLCDNIEKEIDKDVKERKMDQIREYSNVKNVVNGVNGVKEPTWNNNNFYSDYEEYETFCNNMTS